MYIEFNPNPKRQYVGDCVIRAISLATDLDWNTIYISLCVWGFTLADLPSSNQVWGKYLLEHDFKKYPCSDCPTVEKFCEAHPKGTYILATGTHAIACIDGNYYDTWDFGQEIPMYYFKKESES